MANKNTRKPKIDHIIKTGLNEKGEFSKTQKLILKTADSVFNTPSKAIPTFNNKPRKRK